MLFLNLLFAEQFLSKVQENVSGKQDFSALIDIKNEIRWELREWNNAKTDIFILAFQHADNKRFLIL